MEIEFIQHKDILFRDILRIVNIKNVVWPHSLESQLKWIVENQKDKDFHVILKDNDEDLAYLNLCPVKADIDGKDTEFIGIGNVCTKIHGIGYGGILIKEINTYFEKNYMRGLLFCKENVVDFYTNYGWSVITKNIILNDMKCNENVYIMCYNTQPFLEMKYKDRLF